MRISGLLDIGLVANTCIESTGPFAMELGYHVTLVTDATAAFSQEMMQAAHKLNGPTYAHEILTTAELIAALRCGGLSFVPPALVARRAIQGRYSTTTKVVSGDRPCRNNNVPIARAHNLDLAFNSLDAQREACEAYIKSQANALVGTAW